MTDTKMTARPPLAVPGTAPRATFHVATRAFLAVEVVDEY